MKLHFSQNQYTGGFMEGGYDQLAYQPTLNNWTRQSQVNAPKQLTIKWRKEIRSNIADRSIVIGSNGEIYFGSQSGYLYCYSKSGECLWGKLLGDRVNSPVIGADQRIYVTSINHDDMTTIYAIDSDSTIEWSMQIPDMGYYSPIIDHQNQIYIVADIGKIYCINKESGIVWMKQQQYNFWGTPVISSDNRMYIYEGENMHVYDLSGQLIRSNKQDIGSIGTMPVILSNGNLLTIMSDGENPKLMEYNDEGNLMWTYPEVNMSFWNSPALSRDGVVYVSGSEFRVLAIDSVKKTLLWESKTEGFPTSPPIISNEENIIFSTSNDYDGKLVSKIFMFNKYGELLDQVDLPGEITSPSLGFDNNIYVTTNIPMKDKGYLYCIG